ncbi:MAG: hypothetical protein ABFS56_21235 [Pseudomonadota bacterium]
MDAPHDKANVQQRMEKRHSNTIETLYLPEVADQGNHKGLPLHLNYI